MNAQQLNDFACDHTTAASFCGTFLMELVGIRNHWRKISQGDIHSWKNDESRELYQLASEALGAVIHEGVRRQREHERLANKASTVRDGLKPDGPRRTWRSQAEEMGAFHERIEAAKKQNNGCCDGTPDSQGYCFGVGYCPRVSEAKRCEQFIASYMNWLDQINEQAALTAVAVRLSEPPSLDMGVQNVCISDG